MAWDFETEPEFEEQLVWMREFVREEIIPIETLDLTHDQALTFIKPLQDQVRARGLWAAHLPQELGGTGFGQVRLGLMHEILGQTPYGPVVFGNNAPDSGNAELLAAGMEMMDGAQEYVRERWLQPLLDGTIRSGFSMTEPETAGSDPRLLKTRAVKDGDEWVINGHKWYTTNGSVADILVVMAVTNPDIHPYQGSSMFVVSADTPGVDDRARRRLDGRSRQPLRPLRQPRGDPLRRRARPGREPHRPGGFGLLARPGAPRPRSHPSLHALARPVPARLRHDVRARGQSLHARLVALGEADGPELDRRLARRDARGTTDDAARGLEDGPGRRVGRRATRSR